jgi:hypothetical protein
MPAADASQGLASESVFGLDSTAAPVRCAVRSVHPPLMGRSRFPALGCPLTGTVRPGGLGPRLVPIWGWMMAGDGGAAVVKRVASSSPTPQGWLPTWRAQRRFNDDRNPAGGGYVPASRDIRGIGVDLKIMPEASSPVNKGPPAFGTGRSVKPSAQPTLVRTQHPPREFFQLLVRKLSRTPNGPNSKATVDRTVGSSAG